jgi:hypothetical protein
VPVHAAVHLPAAEEAMRLPIYQVDAFTDRLFSGNPAAICPLEA